MLIMIFRHKFDSARGLATASFAAIAMSSVPAFAQQAPGTPAPADDTQYDDQAIVVIGVTKQAANVQDVPTAIVAFSGDDLTDRNVTNIQAIAAQTPGLLIRESPNNSSSINIGLRGQVQNDNLATVDPSVGVYVDGVYWARSYGLNADVLDVRSVQVLKGPQGTLFGRNTSAGALVVETNDPDLNRFGASLSASYGNFNERIGTAVVNIPLIKDRLGVRGAIRINKRDGTVKGYSLPSVLAGTPTLTGARYNNRDILQGRLKVLAMPTDNIEIQLSGEWYDSEQQGAARFLSHASPALGAAGTTLANYDLANLDRVSITLPLDGITGFGPSTQGIAPQPFTNTKTQTYRAGIKFDFGDATFSLLNSYRKVRSHSINDLDGTALVAGNNDYVIDLEQYTSEIQLAGNTFGDKLDYVVGLSYIAEKGNDNSQGTTYTGPAYTSGNTFRSNIKNDAVGIYGQANFHVTDQIDLVAGVRHSWDRRKNVSDNINFRVGSVDTLPTGANRCISPSVLPTADGHCFVTASDSYQAWSYTFGANFHLTDDVMIYAKTGKGYRAGAQQLRTVGIVGGKDTSIASLPEQNFEHEIGIKSQFLDRKITLNIAGYYNTVKDFQSSQILTVPGTTTRYTSVVNPADLRNYGVEADLTVRPITGLAFYGSLAANNEKYKNCANDRCPDYIRDIIQTQFNVGGSYEGDLGFARLGLNVNYSWTGKVHLDAFNREVDDIAIALFGSTAPLANPAVAAQLGALAIPDAEWARISTRRSVGILDARAGLKFGDDDQFEIFAFGRNLTNERYLQHTQYLFSVTTSSIRNDPRTYGVGVSAKF
ncbi:hypothetical protein ATE59_05400 [Sphingopyxis sp. A083]|nr:hypothetical protein ATE59_05400 [Sphingopyxis sp. A083]